MAEHQPKEDDIYVKQGSKVVVKSFINSEQVYCIDYNVIDFRFFSDVFSAFKLKLENGRSFLFIYRSKNHTSSFQFFLGESNSKYITQEILKMMKEKSL